MTKTDIDLMLQEFHEQLHIPLLDATTEAYRQGTPESVSEAVKQLHLASVVMQGIISVVEQSESLNEDQDYYAKCLRWLSPSCPVCRI